MYKTSSALFSHRCSDRMKDNSVFELKVVCHVVALSVCLKLSMLAVLKSLVV